MKGKTVLLFVVVVVACLILSWYMDRDLSQEAKIALYMPY